MAILQEQDIITGSSVGFDTNGIRAVRRFRISGLSTVTNPAARQAEAVICLAQNSLSYGAPHPTINGIWVTKGQVEPFSISQDAVFAVIEYTCPEKKIAGIGQYTIRITGANGTVERSYGATGGLLRVDYLDPSDPSAQTQHDYVTLKVPDATTIIEITRQELGSPYKKAKQYRNAINSAPIWDNDVGEVYCRRYDGEAQSSQNIKVYNVCYQFECSKSLVKGHTFWDQLALFRNFDNGQYPLGIDPTDGSSNGYEWFPSTHFLNTADFNQLGLPDVTI